MKKNLKSFSLVILSIPFLLVNCKDDEQDIPTNCDGIEWTHNGSENGQDDWVNLCEGYSACGGQAQSPINIAGAVDGNLSPALIFSYTKTPVEIENNGHTIEFVCESGSTVDIGSTKYSLAQFHYHAQSEHQLNGTHYPLEVHFVHKASDTDLAVVGVFFEEGAENELLAKYLSDFPLTEGTFEEHSEEIELADLLPANKSYYHYNGSLTTPSCSEVVNWYVLKNTITASASQIAQFKGILNNNFREVKNLNGRVITSHDE